MEKNEIILKRKERRNNTYRVGDYNNYSANTCWNYN